MFVNQLSHCIAECDYTVEQCSAYSTCDRSKYRNPAVTPVATTFTLDRKNSVCDTW